MGIEKFANAEVKVCVRGIWLRFAEVVVAAPQRVWRPKKLFCYVRINGCKIRVPWERYHELTDANMVKIIFLPASRVAVRVEVAHGIGLAM